MKINAPKFKTYFQEEKNTTKFKTFLTILLIKRKKFKKLKFKKKKKKKKRKEKKRIDKLLIF